VPVNCAAIPPNLLESELFGYKKGAFTDASSDRPGLLVEAHEGTLFLDEIGELPAHLQAKLLRVLQEREVKPLGASRSRPIDIRVISATNRDLEAMLTSGDFRNDLYYRLNVVQLDIPPLRKRREDILPIAGHLLQRAAKRSAKEIVGIDPEAARVLMAFAWPGNVRELENVIERAVALSQTSLIQLSDLPPALVERPSEDILRAAAARRMTLADLERVYILQVLDEEEGNKTRASQRLGLDRKTLYRKLEEYRKEDY
jgi:transcriptional regulator with PAS, ATPase and Fis domain